MRQRDFASHQGVIISDVRPLINGAMLQFNTKAGAELFNIELVPIDAQLFADCFCLIQGENPFLAHNITLITDKGMSRGGRETKLLRLPASLKLNPPSLRVGRPTRPIPSRLVGRIQRLAPSVAIARAPAHNEIGDNGSDREGDTDGLIGLITH